MELGKTYRKIHRQTMNKKVFDWRPQANKTSRERSPTRGRRKKQELPSTGDDLWWTVGVTELLF